MRKIPPNGAFSMQSVVVDDSKFINKLTDMFPGLLDRLKYSLALNNDRRFTTNKISEMEILPEFNIFRITPFNIVTN